MFGYFASRCFGRTGNGTDDGAKNVATNGAYGRVSFTAIV
jgi:hypothetical protein